MKDMSKKEFNEALNKISRENPLPPGTWSFPKKKKGGIVAQYTVQKIKDDI